MTSPVLVGECVGQELLVAVVILQSRDGRIPVELERDDVVGLQHVGKLAGHHGVVAAVRAMCDSRHMIDEQLRAT